MDGAAWCRIHDFCGTQRRPFLGEEQRVGKRHDGRPKRTFCSGSGSGTTPGLLRHDHGYGLRERDSSESRKDIAAPAAGQVSDWLSSIIPTRFSHLSHLDPRSFRGHSLQLGRVFDAGGRALDNAIIFCAKCGAVYWEGADALCPQCSEFPGARTSQLCKLRSGLFPNKRHPAWTVEQVRRPTLDEATNLVAQLESCEAGLGRTVMGPTTSKKQRAAPQAAVLAHWERVGEAVDNENLALLHFDQGRSGLWEAYGLNDQLVSKLTLKAGGVRSHKTD